MKKITIILLSLLFLNNVKATEIIETDITENAIIKYKWYIEKETDGTYHKINESLPGYIEDKNKITHGKYSNWDSKYCEYSNKEYLIESRAARWRYKKVKNLKYVILENLQTEDEIKIFSKNQEIAYTEESRSSNKITINLNKNYNANDLIFYIKSSKEYDIKLYYQSITSSPVLSKHIESSFIIKPDKSWIQENVAYLDTYLGATEFETDFNELIEIYNECRVKEIQTYRYKIKKEYYDDNYHEKVEGYTKDENDYTINFIGEFPTNIIEITKTELKPINKYIYLEKLKENTQTLEEQKGPPHQEITAEQTINQNPPKIIEKIKYIDKRIYKIPKYIYLINFILIVIIIIQFLKLLRKKSNETSI